MGANKIFINNLAKKIIMALSGLAALAGLQAVIFFILDKGNPQSFLYISLGTAGFILGCSGIYYGYRYHQNATLVEIGRSLGLRPADSGLTRPDGRFDVKGVVDGVEVLLDGTEIAGSRNQPPRVELDVKCKVPNSQGAWVAAYPDGVGKRPVMPLPAVVDTIPYWDWHVVRSEPTGAAALLISGARASSSTVFREEYGFAYLVLKDRELLCSFKRPGRFSRDYVRTVLSQVVKLASAIT